MPLRIGVNLKHPTGVKPGVKRCTSIQYLTSCWCTCNICTVVDLTNIKGFEWDKWNIDKSYQKHGITPNEAEEVFVDKNVGVERDIKHQETEKRYIAIGATLNEKLLFVVFTMRDSMVRVISSRKANTKERRLYEEAKKNS